MWIKHDHFSLVRRRSREGRNVWIRNISASIGPIANGQMVSWREVRGYPDDCVSTRSGKQQEVEHLTNRRLTA